MENDKTRQLYRSKLTKTIQNKRTISSEQGHYHRSQHQRKFTIEYINPKSINAKYSESIRQPLVQRKNQSLPRTTNSNSQLSIQHNIRSRKLISHVHSIYNDHKSSNKTIPSHNNQSETIKVDYSKNKFFSEGFELFSQMKYSEAIRKFIEFQKQLHHEVYPKNSYYLGLSYWHVGQTQNAIFNLSKAMDSGYQFSTQIYDLLSTFYQSTKNYNCALKTLDHWIKAESSSKAFLMRARINYFFKEYAKAISDYSQCYRIEPTKLEAYIQQAESMYKIWGLDKAIEKYNQLLLNYNRIWPQSQHSDINYVKYKKSLLLLQQKNYQQSLALLNQVSNIQLQSEVGYYTGIIHSILGNTQQALLAFIRSIQSNTSNKFVGQSYYEKFVIMFKRNDYYGIQYQLDIIKGMFFDNQPLQLLRQTIQGVICILKMNFVQGLNRLNKVLDNPSYSKHHKIYSLTISSFKIFGYYSLHRFDEAFEQFSGLKQKKLSESNRYNYVMLKSIKQANQGDYNQSLQLFDEAQKIQPFNTHTFMVKAIVQILFYNSLQSSQFPETYNNPNHEILLSAQQLFNRSLQKQSENDQILYILAVINYQLNQHESGLKLIRKAIEASDDHTIKHYYLKANLKIMLQMYSQAINDYTNAILVMNEQEGLKDNSETGENTKQQPIQQCYLQRAKCYILQKNYEKAESDLRIFFSQLGNVKKYLHQLEMFMHVGCSDVILDIYKSILEQEYDLYSKMKCYYLSKQLNNCLNIMNIMLQFQQEDESETEKSYDSDQLINDRDCLQALKKSSQGSNLLVQQALQTFENKLENKSEGQIFKSSDCMFYAGVMCYLLQQYGKAKNYFIDSKSEKLQKNEISKSNSDEQQLDFENRLYSLAEINYNIGLCDYIQGKWSTYLEQYPQFKKHHQSATQNLVEQNQQITPFVVKNRLCSIYAPQKIGNISFRLSFCLPKIKIKQVSFKKNCQIIKSIGFKDIDMRPSAPWIQKNKKGIIFTTDMLKQSIDLKSEKSKRHNIKKKGQQRYKEPQN